MAHHLTIEQNTEYLKRYAFLERACMQTLAGWLPGVPEWEAKNEFGLHIWESGDAVEIEVLSGLSREEAAATAGRRWDGSGRMSIVAGPGKPDERTRYAVLRVTDSGPGIERQYLPRLSERFYRVDPGRGLRPGTGLGLAIVKHVVQRHRGEFLVESEPGRGSAFGVVLPMPAA